MYFPFKIEQSFLGLMFLFIYLSIFLTMNQKSDRIGANILIIFPHQLKCIYKLYGEKETAMRDGSEPSCSRAAQA